MNKNKVKYGRKLRNVLLKLWNKNMDEIDEYLQFRRYNLGIKNISDIKKIIDEAFKTDELLIDQIDNIIRNAKCDAIQEVFNKMNIKYLDTETVIDYLKDV
ncbi:MAG: hypothetical protein ACFFG0_34880 [Candidatus Thorarchaeota archaeon]